MGNKQLSAFLDHRGHRRRLLLLPAVLSQPICTLFMSHSRSPAADTAALQSFRCRPSCPFPCCGLGEIAHSIAVLRGGRPSAPTVQFSVHCRFQNLPRSASVVPFHRLHLIELAGDAHLNAALNQTNLGVAPRLLSKPNSLAGDVYQAYPITNIA